MAAGDSGTPDYLYGRRGALFTLMQRSSRQMGNWATELHLIGSLKGQAIGVLTDETSDPRKVVINEHLVPALRQHGYSVDQISVLSSDLSTGATQIPVEVQKMRGKNITAVFLATQWPYATQFVQAAASQGWRPAWFASDFASMSSDEANQNMTQAYEGAVAVVTTRNSEWRGGEPEPQPDAGCRSLYEESTKKSLPRNNGSSNNGSYILTVRACGIIQMMTAALSKLKAPADGASLAGALQQIGAVPLPNFGGGSLRPGKFDAADLVRINQWHFDCRCWRPRGPFHVGRA